MERSTSGRKAWFAAQEEAGHSKGVIPRYGLNLLNGGPAAADRISSAIAPSILLKQEMNILCHLSSTTVLVMNSCGFWSANGEENLLELWSVQLLQNT